MTKRRETLWRLVKVVYFLITIPAIALLIFLVKDNYVISRSIAEDDRYQVMNYWSFFAIIILIIISYILLTDGLRKLIGYISSGKFEDWINYKKLFSKFRYVIIAGVLVWCGLFSFGRYYEHQIRNYCREEGAVLSKEGDCSCDETAEMVDGKCQIKDEIKEVQLLSGLVSEYLGTDDIMLLEYSYLHKDPNKGMGIAMKNPIFSEFIEEDLSGESYDISCPASVEGLMNVSGDGYIFVFSKKGDVIKIDDIKKIPSPWEHFSYSYPLVHTKQNSYLYFWGEKPTSEIDENRLVRQYVIDWRDFNGDWEFYEFVLEGYFDWMCGWHDYLFIGYDKKLDKILFYDFDWKATETEGNFGFLYWTRLIGDIKNKFSNGILHQETFCWTQLGGDSDESRDWVYNPLKKVFEMKNYHSRKCSPEEF